MVNLVLEPSFTKTRPLVIPNVYQSYFSGDQKTVIGAWNFTVEFTNDSYFGYVDPFQIVDITIPSYKFQRESVVYGNIPKSYALFDGSGNDREF